MAHPEEECLDSGTFWLSSREATRPREESSIGLKAKWLGESETRARHALCRRRAKEASLSATAPPLPWKKGRREGSWSIARDQELCAFEESLLHIHLLFFLSSFLPLSPPPRLRARLHRNATEGKQLK